MFTKLKWNKKTINSIFDDIDGVRNRQKYSNLDDVDSLHPLSHSRNTSFEILEFHH